jgi:hypothetical protein
MGYIKKSKKERPTGNCASCGKSFVIPAHGNYKKKFCDVKCSGKMHQKRNGSDTKIACLKCHASLLMTGAQSGRLLNWPKQRVSELRIKLGLKTLSNKEAAPKALGFKPKKMDWWGDESAAAGWMSEYRVKDFNWGYLWHKQQASKSHHYYKMTEDEKREFNKKSWQRRRDRAAIDLEYKKRLTQKTKDWNILNKDKAREYRKKSVKKRKIIDPGFKVQCNLRNRLKEIMGRVKIGGTEHSNNLTGCTTKQLALHLESQFKRGMTWENYGKKWHVDHILPCASFDHTNPKQVAQCWHWTNLRALDAITNMKKSDTITKPQMNLLLCSSH